MLITDDAEHAAWFARDLGAAAAFYLPRTPNGRGVADAWSAAADGEPADVEPQLLIDLRRRGRRSTRACARSPSAPSAVIGIGMFEESLPRPRATSSSRARATSSATARPSTSRAGCSASAAP